MRYFKNFFDWLRTEPRRPSEELRGELPITYVRSFL
jgi:hypothetical protein